MLVSNEKYADKSRTPHWSEFDNLLYDQSTFLLTWTEPKISHFLVIYNFTTIKIAGTFMNI